MQFDESPFHRIDKPIAQARVALVTTGGYSIEGEQEPFKPSPSFDDTPPGIHTIPVDVDREKAKSIGVPLDTIFNTLQVNLGSAYVNDFNKFGQTYQVIMQAESPFRSDLSDLESYYVRSERGEMIPLSTLVTTRPILGPDLSERYNLYRSATIRGSPTFTKRHVGRGDCRVERSGAFGDISA